MDSDLSSDLILPQIIVGLGNPGSKYSKTRHNIGFEVVDELARLWLIDLSENRKFQGFFGEGQGPHRQKIRLLKPSTYMNRSGQSIRAVVDWFKLPPESVLIVYDEMALPVGKMRLRLSGSAGGHNGMKSAIAHLGTQHFPRLRVGIGNPNEQDSDSSREVISHVLGKFAPNETTIVREVIQMAVDAIELGLKQGLPKAMSIYNSRSVDMSSL
ncbi:MAG: aminoacyl-tRNA hydrolase [Elainellaceae cyanobacterium]